MDAPPEPATENKGQADPYTDDDEIWKVYEERAEQNEVYVPKVCNG